MVAVTNGTQVMAGADCVTHRFLEWWKVLRDYGTNRMFLRQSRQSWLRQPRTEVAMSTGLKVAFFINGPEKHGIVRASSIIADALCRVNDCSVTVVRSNDPIVNPNASDHFCVVLNEADVVIIHASNRTDDLWGTPRDRPSAIAAFCSRIQKPIVAHLHDVYGETRVTALIRCARQSARAIAVGNVRHMRPALGGLLRILRDRQVMEPIFVEAIDRHVADSCFERSGARAVATLVHDTRSKCFHTLSNRAHR